MVNLQFIIETLIVTAILTAYVTSVHLSQRKKLKKKIAPDCKENLGFFYRHPYWTILINFGAFFILTFLIKLLHDIIFS